MNYEDSQERIDSAAAWYGRLRPDLHDGETHRERCYRLAPHLFAIDANLLSDLVDAIDHTSGEIRENWEAILAAGEATAKSSSATFHNIGGVAPLRADHLRITDRPFVSDPVLAAQREEDPYSAATRSVIVRKRSKRGTYSRVARYGQTLVSGDSRPTQESLVVESALTILFRLAATEQCRRGHGLYDGIGIARVATASYSLPTLIGGEQKSYSEVLPDDISLALRGESYSYGSWTTGPYDGLTRHNVKVARFPISRESLPWPRERDGENLSVRYDISSRTARLVAPASDTEHLFVGHRRTVRPSTVRGKRVARVVRETFLLAGDPLVALRTVAETVSTVAREEKSGSRYLWHVENGARGSLTVTKNGRLSMTMSGSPELSVRGVRTVTTLVESVAPMFT